MQFEIKHQKMNSNLCISRSIFIRGDKFYVFCYECNQRFASLLKIVNMKLRISIKNSSSMVIFGLKDITLLVFQKASNL